MKNIKPIHIAIILIVTGIIIWIVSAIRRNTIIKKVTKAINNTSTITGTINDLQQTAFNANFPASSNPKARVLLPQYVSQYAKQLKDWIGSVYGNSDEAEILNHFKTKYQSKQQIAQVAKEYSNMYGSNLLDDLKTIDYTFLGWRAGDTYMPKIKAIIEALPDYFYL